MKRIGLLFITFLSVVAILGCVSTPDEQEQIEMSNANTFSYFFPEFATIKKFDTIDEAYTFITAAQIKLGKSISKKRAQGLSAKLNGPVVNDDKPAVVAYFLTASSGNSSIDLSKKKEELEKTLKNAVSVSSVFMVFYNGRSVSISDFYLSEGYKYDSNSQFKSFTFRGRTYEAEYPVGWGVLKAFQYLKKEID